MTRAEADGVLQRIRRDETLLWRSGHFLEQLEARRYSIRDAYNVLRRGRIEGEPERDDEHGNHVIRVLGKALDGRPTRLIVGLRGFGQSDLISIVNLRRPRRRG